MLSLRCHSVLSLVVAIAAHSSLRCVGLLTAAASLVVVHGLQGTRASAVAAGGLSGSSSQALERRPNNRGTRA